MWSVFVFISIRETIPLNFSFFFSLLSHSNNRRRETVSFHFFFFRRWICFLISRHNSAGFGSKSFMAHFIRLYRLWSKTKRSCEAEEIYSFLLCKQRSTNVNEIEDLGQMKMGGLLGWKNFQENLKLNFFLNKPGKIWKECLKTFLWENWSKKFYVRGKKRNP